MGSRRKTAISPVAGLFGCLVSALLQVFLALAPVDALADDTGFENPVAASHALTGGAPELVLSGSDPVADTLERAFEPAEFLASARPAARPFFRSSFANFADADSFAGAGGHFYQGRAPPLSPFS